MTEDDIVERRKEWKFLITDEGWGWAVKHPDGREEQSACTYKTLKECADDAMVHGYAEWKSNERRGIEE